MRSSTYPHPHDLLLGFDGTSLASDAAWRFEAPGTVVLALLAVAVDHRGRGGGVARQTAEEIGRRMRQQAVAQHSSQVVVRAYIDEINRPSQALALAHGFSLVAPGPLQQWGAVFDV